MKTRPKIFVSVPDDRHLDDRRQGLKKAIIRFIKSKGFDLFGFEPEQWGIGLPKGLKDWTFENSDKLMRRCDGALVLGLARNSVAATPRGMTTPYTHLEGSLALAHHLPVFIVFEKGMERGGIFNSGTKPASIPTTADHTWPSSAEFKAHFKAWAKEVTERRDVFLGYCSKADRAAINIRDYLENRGFTVLDWARDFSPAGVTILEQIEKAAHRCRCAVFLFTKDDEAKRKAEGKASFDAVPRDNVLLEAGYFTQARGKRRVAIVREVGAKMPSDFGGIIYLSMADREDLSPVQDGIVKFLDEVLTADANSILHDN